MRQLADPACLDGSSERLDGPLRRQFGELASSFANGVAFSNQPDLFAWHVSSSHILNARFQGSERHYGGGVGVRYSRFSPIYFTSG
jgi:hypothetical protein